MQKLQKIQEKKETIKLFAYSISHEKSPAIGLHSLTRLLQRQYGEHLDEKRRLYCDQIIKAAEQIALLIEQINDYIAAREVSLNIERISIRDITARLRDEFSDLLQKHHVAWSEPSALPEIMAYELCVTRDFRNLVNNALKYGGEGLSEIRIDYEESEEHHVFSVSDNGIGIKRKDVARLFQLFYRHKTSKGKEVVKKHLEEVRVEFEPGQWNTFYMLLPKTLKPAGGWWKGK